MRRGLGEKRRGRGEGKGREGVIIIYRGQVRVERRGRGDPSNCCQIL